MPHLEALARRGTSFRRAYSMPVCSPARFGLIFGEFTGLVSGDACTSPASEAPSPTRFSLPELMKSAGCSTALFGKWHLGSNPVGPWESSPQVHGFDCWRAGIPANVKTCGGTSYRKWLRVDDGKSFLSSEYQPTALRSAFLSWWAGTRAPRFGYVGFQLPHSPMHAPPPEFLPAGFEVGTNSRELYEAMLAAADFELGEILAAVDLESTWVIVIGDNGTPPEGVPFGKDTGRAKGTTFERGIRVPLVIAGPGVEKGRETDALAHAVDLFATIADVLGAEIPAGAARDSRSLLPVLRGEGRSAREFVVADVVPDRSDPATRDRAIVAERWKLRRKGVSTEEAYDLLSDPDEKEPLDASASAMPLEARTALETLRRELDAYEKR